MTVPNIVSGCIYHTVMPMIGMTRSWSQVRLPRGGEGSCLWPVALTVRDEENVNTCSLLQLRADAVTSSSNNADGLQAENPIIQAKYLGQLFPREYEYPPGDRRYRSSFETGELRSCLSSD